jgi:hypothetical protein
MKPRIVIWGLKSVRHTHRYIHDAFYVNFQRLGYDVLWLDDQSDSPSLIRKNDVIFVADVARQYLPARTDIRYVLHNISPEELSIEKNYLQLQVYTGSAIGDAIDFPWIKWDSGKRILFQPWGIPTLQTEWLAPATRPGKVEYWVGSIWNNPSNQGNEPAINEYKSSLKKQNLNFKQIGGPSFLLPRGISEESASWKVNRSPIGAAVVGEWQMSNNYIPCRLFKNIASGAIPVSNGNFSEVFGKVGGIFHSHMDVMVENVLSTGRIERSEIVRAAQEKMIPYTYQASINRIMNFLY